MKLAYVRHILKELPVPRPLMPMPQDGSARSVRSDHRWGAPALSTGRSSESPSTPLPSGLSARSLTVQEVDIQDMI